MTRKLALVAATGVIGAVLFLALGIGLAGQSPGSPMNLWSAITSTCGPSAATGQQVTLPFDAVDSLAIGLPATVRHQPGNTAQAVVSGDRGLLAHVRMEDGRLDLDCDPGWSSPRLEVTVSGPPVTEWKLLGNVDLSLPGIDQPQLRIVIRGSGSVTASGTAERVELEISGSGEAKLKALSSHSTQVDIRGSGDAQVTARQTADVSISGSGDVELFGSPVLRRSEIRGSGRITQLP